MRIAIVADVGGSIRDAAAELRARAAVAALGRRGFTPVLLGRDPAVSAAAFAGVEQARLDAPGALAGVDGVYVVGGDLSSDRPWLLRERAALVGRAPSRVRVVLGGQQLGPHVARADEEPLRALLAVADLVTVADPDSVNVWQALGLPGRPPVVPDDLSLLAAEAAHVSGVGPVVATISPDTRHVEPVATIRAIARLVDGLATRHGVGTVLAPPAVIAGGHDVDAAFSERIAATMATPARVERWGSTGDLLAQAARAAAVVTTHPHAALAAAASGRPLVALAQGHAEQTRLDGVLRPWGAGPAVPLAELVDGAGAPVPEHTTPPAGAVAAIEAAWDAVAAALRGAAPVVLGAWAGDDTPVSPPAATPGSGRVLVVTRTKDRSLLLARALDDVLAQTYPDWHHVIVNDAGEPGPVDALVAERAEAYAGRVSVLHRATSSGMEAASNAGVASRDSEFVVIHDDDDTWHRAFLARTVAHLDAHPDEVGVIVRTEEVFERIVEAGILEEDRRIFHPEIREATLLDYLRANRALPIALLYRRSLHDLVGPFPEHLPVIGDWDFHLRTLRAHTVGFLDGAPLAFWRKRRDGAAADGNSVEADRSAHLHHDALLRDAHLKEWVAEQGLGLPLYLARMGDRDTKELHRRLDRLEAQLDEITALLAGRDRPAAVSRAAATVRRATRWLRRG